MIKNNNGKLENDGNLTDLKKSFPKSYFLLPRIDTLIDATAGHEILNSVKDMMVKGLDKIDHINHLRKVLEVLVRSKV